MKSFQVRNVYGADSSELKNFSDLQVCSSAAGYFLDTVYDAQEGYAEPGSRDTDYYRNKADAEFDQALDDAMMEAADAQNSLVTKR